jgi:hypothetical protein
VLHDLFADTPSIAAEASRVQTHCTVKTAKRRRVDFRSGFAGPESDVSGAASGPWSAVAIGWGDGIGDRGSS